MKLIIHVTLWELSVTRQFSLVKFEVGIWSWITFFKQKCVVSSSLSKYLTYQTFFCEVWNWAHFHQWVGNLTVTEVRMFSKGKYIRNNFFQWKNCLSGNTYLYGKYHVWNTCHHWQESWWGTRSTYLALESFCKQRKLLKKYVQIVMSNTSLISKQ